MPLRLWSKMSCWPARPIAFACTARNWPAAIRPGQFVMLRLPGHTDPLLGRPFALYDTVLDEAGQPVPWMWFISSSAR